MATEQCMCIYTAQVTYQTCSSVCQLIGSVSLVLNERLAVVKTTDQYVVLEYNYGQSSVCVCSVDG